MGKEYPEQRGGQERELSSVTAILQSLEFYDGLGPGQGSLSTGLYGLLLL